MEPKHPGCTAHLLPDHRWTEVDYTCHIRPFYGPKRAIPSQQTTPLVYTLEECRQCAWFWWATASGHRRGACHHCYRARYAVIKTCPSCGQPHRKNGAHCMKCQSAALPPCMECGRPTDAHSGVRCFHCYKATLDPAKVKAQRRRSSNARRARKEAAQVAGPVPLRVYKEVVESGPCVYCDAEADTVDHIIPLARGGHEAEYNLVPACHSCNSSKCAKLLTEWYPDRVAHAVATNTKIAAVWGGM